MKFVVFKKYYPHLTKGGFMPKLSEFDNFGVEKIEGAEYQVGL